MRFEVSFSKPPKVGGGATSWTGMGEWSRSGIVGILGGVTLDTLRVRNSCRARPADTDLAFVVRSFETVSLFTPRAVVDGELLVVRLAGAGL